MTSVRRLALGLAVATTMLSGAVSAQETCTLPFEVYLTDSGGAPVDGPLPIELHFYDQATDGTPLECRAMPDATVVDGWLRVELDTCGTPGPGDCGTSSLQSLVESTAIGGDRLFVGVVLVDDAVELSPRYGLGSVPYSSYANAAGRAYAADVCSELAGFDPGDYLRSDAPIDADTLDGLDSLDFLLAGDPIDADTLGGLTADDIASLGSGLSSAAVLEISASGLPRTLSSFDAVDFELPFAAHGTVVVVELTVGLRHPNTAELRLSLVSPSGSVATLHDGGPGTSIACRYPSTCSCAGATCMETFVGEEAFGRWTLRVLDTVPGNAATLDVVSLRVALEDTAIGTTESAIARSGRVLDTRALGGAGTERLEVTSGVVQLAGNVRHEFESIYVGAGATVTTSTPGRPIFLFARNDIVVHGTVDVSGLGMPGGAGGVAVTQPRCASGAGGEGGAGGGGVYLEAGGGLWVGPSGSVLAEGSDGRPGSAAGACAWSETRAACTEPSAGVPFRDFVSLEAPAVPASRCLRFCSDSAGGGEERAGPGIGGFGPNAALENSVLAVSLGWTPLVLALPGLGGSGGPGGGIRASPASVTCAFGGGGGGGGGGGMIVLRAGRGVVVDGRISVEGGAGGAPGPNTNDQCVSKTECLPRHPLSASGLAGEAGLVVIDDRRIPD